MVQQVAGIRLTCPFRRLIGHGNGADALGLLFPKTPRKPAMFSEIGGRIVPNFVDVNDKVLLFTKKKFINV